MLRIIFSRNKNREIIIYSIIFFFLLLSNVLFHFMRKEIISTAYIFFILQLLFLKTQAIEIYGRVTANDGTALAYANVFLKGTSKGTTTNLDGYYKLDATPGNYILAAKYLGYAQKEKPVTISATATEINFELQPENFQIKEVTIIASEDPAYAIIKQAIRKRKFYLEQVDAFSCNVYIKGVQKMKAYPKKLMGVKVDFGGQLDSATGIFYLSESVSKLSYKKPNHIAEEMVSSRISGNNKAFSFNQASEMMFNFYENNVDAQAISPRGFISPIASSALLYYRYELLGTTVENDLLVHKIKVTPRRKHDPAFSGLVYIQDSTWRLQSVDVLLTKDAGMEFVDTLRIRQMHIPVSNDVWLPASNKFDFDFSFLGFKGGGTYVSVQSDYNITPAFSKKHFSGEILKVNDDANKRDTTYWETIRPIPLTLDETNDYVKKDSISVLRESKAFKDSLDGISNKFSTSGLLLSGYSYRNRYRKMTYSVSSLLSSVQYNTVEGLALNVNASITKTFERRRRLTINPRLRYGFSNTHFNPAVMVKYDYNPKKFGEVILKGGSVVSQFNIENPVSEFFNTFYTLIDKKNYLKIFEKRFASVYHRHELINGIYTNAQIETAQRIPLTNTTDYSFSKNKNRDFTPNVPAPESFANIPIHNLLTATVGAEFHIKQKYITRPDVKYITETKFPKLYINYTKAFEVNGDYTNYDKYKAGIKQDIALGMLGYITYEASYESFISKKSISTPDLLQVTGNLYYFSTFKLTQFNLLDYYTYSSAENVLQAHAEYHMSGFLFNKIPLLRKLKLDEIAGVHYLKMPDLADYTELNFGVEKLGFIRLDFVMGFSKKQTTTGLRVGFKLGGE